MDDFSSADKKYKDAINKLKYIIDTKVKALYNSLAEIEYILALSQGYKRVEIEIIKQIKEEESKGKIKKELAEKEITVHEDKIYAVDSITANFKKLQRKLDFMWNFISWKYSILLSENMKKMAKTNNRLAIIAIIIAITSLIISLFL